ncbi:hypothetical protein KFK09_006759 [Dendrobium nobile]|uniref:Uncharacterized protein n=1 Tax=Dendrobium nobile TaxID=94219 RepID=A0A8T3BUE6_DENNO|nr:hypothetical protein KFK09_006759 [Dendrobium nobile]
MCILCVVQRWSRRVATMLPWLVIPLIVLWALSQLLPPPLRFEITSPRLACVLVLLATLFWYEILMPHLSSWRARRAARLRERRRTEALELQKLRKTATRRCRNCHMPYRDQNPGGGRFMCSYCGHISKRPELDLPDQMESPGIIADVVGKNGWLCYADGNGNWAGSDPKYWNGSDRSCSMDRSCFGLIFFACKLLSCFFSSVRWLHGKIFRFGTSREDGSSDLDHRGLPGKGENCVNFHESRGEKARRKAEEKRQARLEKEMLEEEERKQREEVARLVEERRRQRDEMLAAEKERSKGLAVDGGRDGKKEMDRRRKDRRKDKDKASSKSNSDVEEHEKRASRENERKREFEKKVDNELRDFQKGATDNYKSQALEGVHGNKVAVNNSRYFDRMKGSFLYSSRGFAGPFFGRNVQNSPAVTKITKPSTGIIDHGHNSGNRRDTHPLVHVASKSSSSAGDKASETNLSRIGTIDVQPKTTVTKKSWQQLFTRSSAVSPYPDAKSTGQVNQTGQLADRGDLSSNKDVLQSYSTTDNLVDYGKSLPYTAFPPASISFPNNPIFPIVPDTTFPPLEEPPRSSLSEDAELFEDPCYDPDPISLLGPVSESLDKFPSDLESGFTTRNKTEGSSYLKNVLTSADVNKPSPIEPPLSKVNFPEGKHSASDQLFCSPNSDLSSNILEQSTWKMWGSPLPQEGMGLIGHPNGWFSPLVQNNSQQQDFLHSRSHRPIEPPISKTNNKLMGISSQYAHNGNHEHNCGTYSPLGPSFNDNGIWQQNFFESPSPMAVNDHLLPIDLMVKISQGEATYSTPIKSTTGHPFETNPITSWPKDDSVLDAPQQIGNLNLGRPNVGSLFSRGPDVPSVWSFTK